MIRKNRVTLSDLKKRIDHGDYTYVLSHIQKFIGLIKTDSTYEAICIKGIAQYKTGDYEGAQYSFTKVAKHRDDCESWFNVLTAAVLAGDLYEGEACFSRLKERHEYSSNELRPSLPLITYNYILTLCDIKAYDQAIIQLEALAEVYSQATMLDARTLKEKGVPDFSATLLCIKNIREVSAIKNKVISIILNLYEEVGEEGKKEITRILDYSA